MGENEERERVTELIAVLWTFGLTVDKRTRFFKKIWISK